MVRPTQPFHGAVGAGGRNVALEYRTIVGNWLRAKRQEAGLTQKQVNDLIDVESNLVAAVESGRSTIPPSRYEALANALSVSHEEFATFLLRYDNPWLYKMIHGSRSRKLKEELESIPDRVGINPFARKATAE